MYDDSIDLSSGFAWIEDSNTVGEMLFTFDGKTIYNLFQDYPNNLTPEQKELFDKENPYWADFFSEKKL